MENFKKFSLFDDNIQTITSDHTNMLDKNDPMNMFTSAKYKGIVTEDKKRQHKEADLHLAYVSWLRKQYPHADFVRHEKERSRSHYLGNLMQKYNSLDGLPDFELLEPIRKGFAEGDYFRLYIEFKKPGEHWLEARTGLVKKAYTHQYLCHVKLWQKGSCAYFCNDFDIAIELTNAYMNGNPLPQQIYSTHNPPF